MQRFRVAPNEIAMEREFIEYNIDMTLKGYGLDTIQEIDFTVKNDLSWDDLLKNEETIKISGFGIQGQFRPPIISYRVYDPIIPFQV